MDLEEIDYLSLYGKRINKYIKSTQKNTILKRKFGKSHSQKSIGSYNDKNGIEMKKENDIAKDRKTVKSFLKYMNELSERKKENIQDYFSKLKGYKNSEEERRIKERRERRSKEIMNLKKKREFSDSQKLFPNYNEIYCLIMSKLQLNEKEIKEIKEKEKKDKSHTQRIIPKIRTNNVGYHNSVSMPSINKDRVYIKQPIEKTAETSISTGIFKLTKNKDRNDNIKKRHVRLFNKELRQKIYDSSQNNNYYSSICNSSVISNNNTRTITPIKNNSPNNNNDSVRPKIIIKSNINNNNQSIKRNNSSLLIGNNDDSNKSKRMIKLIKYKKKWDSPKSVLFDKVVGRYDLGHKRFTEIKGTQNYFPNYNAIYSDNNKSYVHYGKNKEVLFKNLKVELTRKLICNSHNLMNSQTNSYNVIDLIKKHKQKVKQEKLNKLKEKYGPYYEFIEKIKKNEKI